MGFAVLLLIVILCTSTSQAATTTVKSGSGSVWLIDWSEKMTASTKEIADDDKKLDLATISLDTNALEKACQWGADELIWVYWSVDNVDNSNLECDDQYSIYVEALWESGVRAYAEICPSYVEYYTGCEYPKSYYYGTSICTSETNQKVEHSVPLIIGIDDVCGLQSVDKIILTLESKDFESKWFGTEDSITVTNPYFKAYVYQEKTYETTASLSQDQYDGFQGARLIITVTNYDLVSNTMLEVDIGGTSYSCYPQYPDYGHCEFTIPKSAFQGSSHQVQIKFRSGATAKFDFEYRVEVDYCDIKTWYRDADGDGYGNPSQSTRACNQPSGYVSNNLDCDDSNRNINPNTIWYKDSDNDGYSDGTTRQQCQRPSGYKLPSELISTSGDCNDNDASVHPGAAEICNGKDDDCDGQTDENACGTTQPPVADFTISPSSPVVGQEIIFDAAPSYDPDGQIVSYYWDFGDGTTSEAELVMKTYSQPGTYTVTLTVTDNDGLTASTSKQITVSTSTSSPPVASFTYTASGLTVTFDASSSYDPDGSIVSYSWSFGDGSTASGITITHTYSSSGDVDWVKFYAQSSCSYTIETYNLGENSDTVIYLYDSNGNQIEYNDDYNGLASRIDWTCSQSGYYYVKIRHYSNSTYGEGTDYWIRVDESCSFVPITPVPITPTPSTEVT